MVAAGPGDELGAEMNWDSSSRGFSTGRGNVWVLVQALPPNSWVPLGQVLELWSLCVGTELEVI